MSERDDALTERLKNRVAAYKAMSQLDKALHDAEQRRSFVRGQSGRDPGPDVLAEEVRALRTRLSSAEAALKPYWRRASTMTEIPAASTGWEEALVDAAAVMLELETRILAACSTYDSRFATNVATAFRELAVALAGKVGG